MVSTVRLVTAAFASLVVGLPQSASASTTQEAKAVATVLSRFETALFVTAPLAKNRPDPEHLLPVDVVRGPVGYAREALDLAASGAASRVLAGSTSIVVGAKDSRAPGGSSGLGGVQSTRCVIFVLRSDAKLDPRALFRSVSRTEGQVPVWSWRGPRGEGDPDVVPVFAATATSSYLILGNSRDEVVALVRALGRKMDAPLPSPLEQPGVGDQPAWAYRAYRHTQPDPMAAGTEDIAPSTKALVVVPGPRAITVRLLGTDDTSARRLNERTLFAPFTQGTPGVWQTSVPVTAKDRSTAEAFLGVLYLLGFGVYL